MQYLSGFFRIIKRGGSASVRPARVLRGGFARALPQPVKTGADRFQPVCGVKVVPFWNICGQCSKIEHPALPGPIQACAGMAPRPPMRAPPHPARVISALARPLAVPPPCGYQRRRFAAVALRLPRGTLSRPANPPCRAGGRGLSPRPSFPLSRISGSIGRLEAAAAV